jgi:4'-phosphopantetheinyl transferase
MIDNAVADEWDNSSDGIEIGETEAHAWRAWLNQDTRTISELLPLLSPDERLMSERYYREADRNRFIFARGVLRKIISTYLLISPGELRFTYNEFGKPAVSNDQNDLAINFNLSHSKDIVLYTFARGRAVGVDVEYIREDFATLEIAEHFFSKDEVRTLGSLPVGQRTKAFFACWSRKESFIKAVGMGVSYPLDRFSVSLAPDDPPALLKVDDDDREACRWEMFELTPGIGYAAALVVEKPPVILRKWRW